jgi:hypothetical protein
MLFISYITHINKSMSPIFPYPVKPGKYVGVVQKFADIAIKYGKDHWGPINSPLFVDALNVNTKEPYHLEIWHTVFFSILSQLTFDFGGIVCKVKQPAQTNRINRGYNRILIGFARNRRPESR